MCIEFFYEYQKRRVATIVNEAHFMSSLYRASMQSLVEKLERERERKNTGNEARYYSRRVRCSTIGFAFLYTLHHYCAEYSIWINLMYLLCGRIV